MKTLTFSLVLASLLSTCKTTQTSALHKATLSPSALLGSAYDASINEYTGMSCVDTSALGSADYEYIAATWGETQALEEPQREALEGIFGHFQSSFYTEATGLRLSRPREAINRIRSGPLEKTQLLVLSSRKGQFRIRPASLQKLKLTPEAEALVSDPEAFTQLCGTDFLSGTGFTVGIGATLRLSFANPNDREAFTGSWQSLDEGNFALAATLHYESYLKETWDVNFRVLGDPVSRDCPPGGYDPCLDAFRIFQNITVPKYQKMMISRLRDADLVLPLAYLTDAEKTSYGVLVSEWRSQGLGPSEAEKAAWAKVREGFVDLYAKAAKPPQDFERMQTISSLAAPCYRPQLDRVKCATNLLKIQQNPDQP